MAKLCFYLRFKKNQTAAWILFSIWKILLIDLYPRMRKKDEGSYALDEPRRSPNVHLYSKAPSREFFAWFEA